MKFHPFHLIAPLVAVAAPLAPASAMTVQPVVVDLRTAGREMSQVITVENTFSRQLPVELTVQGVDKSATHVRVIHHRIDDEHSNAYTAWQAMGSPQEPSPEQREALLKASELTRMEAPKAVAGSGGRTELRFTMPRQSVSLIQLHW